MLEEGERRIVEWRMRRAEEVLGVWEGFVGRWEGCGKDSRGRRVEVKLVRDGEGGYVVEGLP